MLKLKWDLKLAKFNMNAFKRDMRPYIENALRGSIQAWLKELQLIVPVWSGRSLSTMSEAAAFANARLNLTPKPNALLKNGGFREGDGPAPELGYFTYSIDANLNTTAKIGTKLDYWANENEIKRVKYIRFTSTPMPPWHSFDRTRKTLERALINRLKKNFPGIKKYIVMSR